MPSTARRPREWLLTAIVVSAVISCVTTGRAWATQFPDSPVIDMHAHYSDPYGDGRLPVGDGQYSTQAPAVGKLFVCPRFAERFRVTTAGARDRGPWFSADHRWFYPARKVDVQGEVMWPWRLSISRTNTERFIHTNDLPAHGTGEFPIRPSDPAHDHDRNPNHIAAQDFSYQLPRTPVYGQPVCVGSSVGVMSTGVALFSALDATGRDALAWEVQDTCEGHPEVTSAYHYHSRSTCGPPADVTTVIGWALDGYPITGALVSPGSTLTTRDLDVCHGIVGPVTQDDATVITYHYVLTADFPYSVGCFRGTPTAVQGMRRPGAQPTPAVN